MADLIIQPFTVAVLDRLPEAERKARMSVIGVRHMKRTRQMKWDGSDMERGYEMARAAISKATSRQPEGER